MWRILSIVAFVPIVLACGAGNASDTEHESAQPIPEAWRACEADADCARVAIACCDCGRGDYVGVHQSFARQAREAAGPSDCERCPQQDCPANDAVCRAGRCEVVDR